MYLPFHHFPDKFIVPLNGFPYKGLGAYKGCEEADFIPRCHHLVLALDIMFSGCFFFLIFFCFPCTNHLALKYRFLVNYLSIGICTQKWIFFVSHFLVVFFNLLAGLPLKPSGNIVLKFISKINPID